MKSNTFKTITTFGESHGTALGIVIEDIIPNIDFPYDELRKQLAKRRPATSKYTSQRQETDDFQILSGVFEGKTTGMPICILFSNTDHKSSDYDNIKDIFRPGHADYSWTQKFKIHDYRGGGRASGRTTICHVAAGALVKHTLGDIAIHAFPISVGATLCGHPSENPDSSTNENVLNLLKTTKQSKDTVGAIVECVITNIPAGLGDPIFESLDANLAKAIIGIPGVKGIEFGDGFALATKKGSETNDQQTHKGYLTNHLGGIIGGVSNGNDIIFRVAVRAPSSIGITQNTLTKDGKSAKLTIKGRHDTCLVPRILPVIESMTALVLADAIAHQNLITQTPLSLSALRETIDKIDEDILIALYRRKEIVALIAQYKKDNNVPIYDPQREEEIIKNLTDIAKEFGLSSTLIKQIWQLILAESVSEGKIK